MIWRNLAEQKPLVGALVIVRWRECNGGKYYTVGCLTSWGVFTDYCVPDDHTRVEWLDTSLIDRDRVRELALEAGFKLKPQPNGKDDLNHYVYEFAAKLLADVFKWE